MCIRDSPSAVCVAADGQEPHGGLPCAVSVAADGQEPHGGLPCAVSVVADGHKPNGAACSVLICTLVLSKYLTRKKLLSLSQPLKNAGQNNGFTNCCFYSLFGSYCQNNVTHAKYI